MKTLDVIQTGAIVATVLVMAWTTVRQLRAYLGVSARWRDGDLDSNQQLYCDANRQFVTGLFVTNHGLTPARNVRVRASMDILPATLAPDAIHVALCRQRSHPINEAPRVANPGNSLPLFYQIAGGDATKVPGPGESIYVFGEVKYDDVFGVERLTRFASYWDPMSTTGSGWRAASQHNDSE